jgi:hypothetical protein
VWEDIGLYADVSGNIYGPGSPRQSNTMWAYYMMSWSWQRLWYDVLYVRPVCEQGFVKPNTNRRQAEDSYFTHICSALFQKSQI